MTTNSLIPSQIAGVGFYVPEHVVTNDDLSKLVDTSDEWIVTRTGIKERRVVSGDETAVTLGIKAAEMALANAKMKPEEVELIIAAASVPNMMYPSCACEIQNAIGAVNAAGYDLTAACSGLMYAMTMAKGLINSGIYEKILIVATDANSKFVDWSDRTTCILFGDGAGAVVMKRSEDGVEDILAIDISADGAKGKEIQMPISGKNCPLVEPCEERKQIITMNGREVYKFVMNTMPSSIDKCIAKSGLKVEDIDYFIPHQANLRIIEGLQSRLEYSDDKVVKNIDKYGNTSAASIPIALVEAVKSGQVKLPSTAMLCAFGAGMTWGTIIVRLRENII